MYGKGIYITVRQQIYIMYPRENSENKVRQMSIFFFFFFFFHFFFFNIFFPASKITFTIYNKTSMTLTPMSPLPWLIRILF